MSAIADLTDPATPKKWYTRGLSDLYELLSLLKSGICESHVVMDARAHTVVWDGFLVFLDFLQPVALADERKCTFTTLAQSVTLLL